MVWSKYVSHNGNSLVRWKNGEDFNGFDSGDVRDIVAEAKRIKVN